MEAKWDITMGLRGGVIEGYCLFLFDAR